MFSSSIVDKATYNGVLVSKVYFILGFYYYGIVDTIIYGSYF